MTTITPEIPHFTAPEAGPARPGMQTLLSAVRGRLWLGQFAVAVRAAAWATAGVMLLAAAVHATARPVPVGAVLAALGLIWSVWLARAAWQRPADRACALWADQHLGGASAFSTLLETRQGARARGHAQAVRQLENWVSARLPHSLRQLAVRRDPARLARPMLAMVVCGALATLVLTLPGPSPTPQPFAAAPAGVTAPDAALRLADAPEPAALAGEIAAALRAAPSRDAEAAGGGRRSPAAGPVRADDAIAPVRVQAGPAPAGARPADKPLPLATADAASPARAGATPAAGSGGGREAGDSADARAGTGMSRALRGTMDAQGVTLAATRPTGQRQADSDQAASYESDDSETGRRVATAVLNQSAPAAATPPPATESTRLTPTQTSYVQAWMKASQRRP